MDRSKLQELAKELAKDLKTQADLSALTSELVKLTVETALNAELTAHLGYDRHQERVGKNARNGTSSKRVKGNHGEVVMIPLGIAMAHLSQHYYPSIKPA